MRRNPCTSCHRSQEIGAGCSQSSRPRRGGCAVARGSCKQAPGSVAPAPLCEREQTDRQTDSRQTDSRGQYSFCLCDLPCGLCAPLCRGSSGPWPVRGRCAPVAGCPGALCVLRNDSAPGLPSPWAVCSEAGAVCPGAGCPGARCGLRHDLAPASRPRRFASRPPCAKRLHPYQVTSARRVERQGWRGFSLRVASGLCPVLRMGVIL